MLSIHREDDLAIVQMSHGRANALDTEFCCALADQFESFDLSVRGVVLTAEGSIFCAGVDLLRLSSEPASYTQEFLPALNRAFVTLFSFDRPLVAAINGHAIAGGCILACTADYRVMRAGTSKFGVPELKVGVPFPPSALEILRFAAPDRYVQELTSGDKIYAPAVAHDHGLVHDVVPEDDLLSRARTEARRLASLHPSAFSLTKSMLRKPSIDRIVALDREFNSRIESTWLADDTRAAIRQYADRTLNRRG